MARPTEKEAEDVLNDFAEKMFKLMMDHHQLQISRLDLTMPQAQALKVLRQGPVCTGELAMELSISAPAVSQLTDRLTRKQLIVRRAHNSDRRSVLVALTERGRRAVDQVRARRHEIFLGALAYLTDVDREEVVSALGKVVAALEHFETETASKPGKASNRISHPRQRKQA